MRATRRGRERHNVLLSLVVINFASSISFPKKKPFFLLSVYALLFLFHPLSIICCLHNFETISSYKFCHICRNTQSKTSLYSKVPKQVQRSTIRPKINCSLQFSNAGFCLVGNWEKGEGKKRGLDQGLIIYIFYCSGTVGNTERDERTASQTPTIRTLKLSRRNSFF